MRAAGKQGRLVFGLVLLMAACGCQYGDRARPLAPMGDASLGMAARMIEGDHAFSDLGARGVQRVMVTKVVPGGPADQGGIRPGAILQTIDGHRCRDAESLIRRVRNLRPGDQVEVTFIQDAETHRSQLRVARSTELWGRPTPNRFDEPVPSAEVMQGF